jgi:hypothetical protein
MRRLLTVMTLIAPLVSGVSVARAADADDRTPLRLEHHTVKLRFTLAGTPPPMLPAPTPGPRGQAVLSVRVDLVRRLARDDFKRGTT